jgi:hypothetical protein
MIHFHSLSFGEDYLELQSSAKAHTFRLKQQLYRAWWLLSASVFAYWFLLAPAKSYCGCGTAAGFCAQPVHQCCPMIWQLHRFLFT